jgi:hypothetical protein
MTRLQQLLMSSLIGSTVVLGACSSMTPSQQRVAAAAAGGATGAAVGEKAGGRYGAVIGGALGAGAGSTSTNGSNQTSISSAIGSGIGAEIGRRAIGGCARRSDWCGDWGRDGRSDQ